MTLDEKIELFSKAVIDSATKQNIEIVRQYKESLRKYMTNIKKIP